MADKEKSRTNKTRDANLPLARKRTLRDAIEDARNQGPDLIFSATSGSRISTHRVAQAVVEFSRFEVFGRAVVDVFKSKSDDGERNGVVLRLSVRDRTTSFLPFVQMLGDDTAKLHFAGGAEAAAWMRALKNAIDACESLFDTDAIKAETTRRLDCSDVVIDVKHHTK